MRRTLQAFSIHSGTVPTPYVPFRAGLATFGTGEILIAGHNDADGLAASAILARGLARHGRATQVRIIRFVRDLGFGADMEVQG